MRQQGEVHHGHAAGHGELGHRVMVIASLRGIRFAKRPAYRVGIVVKAYGCATRGQHGGSTFKLRITLFGYLIEKLVPVGFGGTILHVLGIDASALFLHAAIRRTDDESRILARGVKVLGM